MGASDSLQAKLAGLFRGLQLAMEMNIHRLQCYSDSVIDVELVSKGGGELHHYASLIRSIHELLELEWEVEPVHTFREGNNCADFMAQLGVDLAERHWRFDASPAGLRVLLATDTKRTPFLRV